MCMYVEYVLVNIPPRPKSQSCDQVTLSRGSSNHPYSATGALDHSLFARARLARWFLESGTVEHKEGFVFRRGVGCERKCIRSQ
jgi:hypothetical protein